jgi:hypothetical protein
MARQGSSSRPIERGRPGPGLLAHVLVSKYADHLPLYRLSQIFAREGVDIDRSTMADWVGRSTTLLEPLADAIGRIVRRGPAQGSRKHEDTGPPDRHRHEPQEIGHRHIPYPPHACGTLRPVDAAPSYMTEVIQQPPPDGLSPPANRRSLPGIGPITASVLAATLPDVSSFRSARDLSASCRRHAFGVTLGFIPTVTDDDRYPPPAPFLPAQPTILSYPKGQDWWLGGEAGQEPDLAQ